MAQWKQTDAANKRGGSCVYCHTPIATGAGLLVWHYGEPDFADSDCSAKAPPKLWAVQCCNRDECASAAKRYWARQAVEAAREQLNHLGYGDWTEEARAAARVGRQSRLDAAEAHLAELIQATETGA